MPRAPEAIVVMGVTGAGKTTVARGLARHLRYQFLDADDFHAHTAKAQMAAGVPLTDEQREPWVMALGRELRRRAELGQSSVLAFSGLRAAHRQRLRESRTAIRFVFLQAAPSAIAVRLGARTGHFMPATLLESQFEAMQSPIREGDVVVVDADGTPAQVLSRALAALSGTEGPATPSRT